MKPHDSHSTYYKNILRSLPQYLFFKNRHSVYLGCNENFAALVGLRSPEDIVGKTDLELNWQPAGHTADIFRRGDQDTMQGHPLTNQQETLVLPNGRKLITLVSKLPIVDDDNTVLGVVGYFSDITVLKEQERELQQARQQAEAANQAKSQFITNISHDIRTPLTAVISIAQLLAQSKPEKWNQSDADDLLKAAQSLLNLMNEIIEYSKWESGDLPVYEVRFNLREIVSDVMDLCAVSAKEKQLEFECNISEDIPDYFIGDNIRLKRILLNLINNAIKFTEKGSVTLSIEMVKRQKQKQIIKICVVDTGIGIPKEKQSIIFTRFSRLNPAYEGRYAGVGLGLPLVKQIITEIGGEIDIESTENHGATFTCLIPLRVALLSNAEQMQQPPSIKSLFAQPNHSHSMAQQILLVEDNLLVQRVLKAQLENLKIEVHTAGDGAQALERIQSTDYALVIMDIGLPDQDGCAVAEAIHRYQKIHRRPLTPIIALSAHIDESEQQRCLSSGMIRAWNKPLDQSKIQEIATLLTQAAEPHYLTKRGRHE